MSNLALYRKYRPSNFSDVSGQDTVIRILKNQIINDRVGHAYLLSGIRGTGKTTIAKIFAKAVNCENPINGEACGVCETCKLLEQENNMNIIEIDAASNRGVDEIRNLKETVKYPPSVGKYKVYIIDEVHMLTKEAFNALLKTLEEPPSHAMFILATTEAHRLPATILSRCQKFNIRPISDDLVLTRLEEICQKENINIENTGLKEIAIRGQHSMRDALSLLDQCADLNLPGEEISKEEIQDFLGIAPTEQLINIAQLLAQKNGAEILKALNTYRSQGREDMILLEDLTHFFQSLLYYKLTNTKDNNFDESFNSLKDQFSQENLYQIIDTLIKAYSRLRFNALSEIVTNTALLGLCSEEISSNDIKNQSSVKSINSVINKTPIILQTDTKSKVTKIPNQNESKPKKDIKVEQNEKESITAEKEKLIKKTEQTSKPDLVDVKSIRLELIDLAEKQNEMLIKKLIENSELKYNRNGLFILLDEQYRFLFDTTDFYRRVQHLVNQAFGRNVKVYPKIKQEYEEYLQKHHLNQKKETEQDFDVEKHIKKIIGSDNIVYHKVEN